MRRPSSGFLGLAIVGLSLSISAVAAADEYDFTSFDSGGGSFSDPVGTGYSSYGSYAIDYLTGNTLADNSLYNMPNVGTNWDLASTVPEGGYTIINNVMWPTCYGCTAGLTGQESTMLGVYDAYRQYNSWSLFFGGYGWTDSMYMGTYQGDSSFFVSNNFAFTHDFAVEVYGQSMFNLNTPYCPSLCVANMSAGTLTDAITGNSLTNRIGQVYDSTFGTPAVPPPYTGGGDGDGDGDGDGA